MDLFICKGCGFESQTWSGVCPKCAGHSAVSMTPVADPNVGRVVAGRYKLLKKLGEGGMGSVWAAEQVGVGNSVAVKFLRRELSSNPDLTRRFLNEARTYIRVAHPGAVQLHDFGRDEATGDLFISMELVDGVDLGKLLAEEHRLPLAAACDIALQIADVLAHAHARGVVHRDLKPENVMVRRSLAGFHVKLLDFGIARLVFDDASRLTNAGAMAGTPRYMAPEQVRGEDVDARADVYALGLVFFEMLSGIAGVQGGALPEVLSRQVNDTLPPLAQINAELASLPPEVDVVIARATAKSRDQRTANMQQLATQLAGLAGREAMTLPGPVPAADFIDKTFTPAPRARATDFPAAPPPPPPAVATVASAPKRSALLPVALMVALVAGALVFAWLLRSRPPGPTTAHVTTRDPVGVAGCPGLELYNEELQALTVPQLEEKVAALPYMMPSAAKKFLQTLQLTREGYAADKRDCMYRLSLMGTVAQIRTVIGSTPALFGHTSTPQQLRDWFIELPLRNDWSTEQRLSVLDQIDGIFLPNLKVDAPGDAEFWKRQYYGIELTCEASDATLKQLKAPRNTDCLNLKPKF